MCNEISKRSGKKCKLQPTEQFCFVHKAKIAKEQFERTALLSDYKKDEIKHLNKSLRKQSEKLNELWAKILSMKQISENLTQRINSMQESYDAYEKIKYFEHLKHTMQKFVDVYDLDQLYRFCIDKNNKKILDTILGEHDDHYKYYNKLRWERNQLCHLSSTTIIQH